jgi:hypothetical protein
MVRVGFSGDEARMESKLELLEGLMKANQLEKIHTRIRIWIIYPSRPNTARSLLALP